MARRKAEEPASIEGGWINTFADLMNLLLCFFVLLFSMSTVDADKYEQIVTSLSESIDIFSDGGNAVGEGAFVSSGTSQKISMEEYFNEFENSGQDQKLKDDSTEISEEEKYKQKLEEQLKEKTEALYAEVSDKAAAKKIQDMVNVNMDEQYQYVQISLNGAILFDSGSDQIKKSAIPLLSKVGDILKIYDDHMIKIEGHTDNVPISSSTFKNNMWLSTARATQVFEYFTNQKHLDPKTLETTGRSQYDPVADNKTEKGRARNRRVEIKIYTEEGLWRGKITFENKQTINLKPDEGDNTSHFAVLEGVTISFNKEAEDYQEVSESVKAKDVYITEIVKETIADQSMKTLDQNAVKEQALAKIQDLYGSKCIVRLALDGFMFQ